MKKNQNWLLWRNLIYSLVLFGQIKTTKSRAKAISGLVDRLVNKIKKNTVASKREVVKVLPQRKAYEKLVNKIVPLLNDRNSGYTRIINLGSRIGDNAKMVLMEWAKSIGPEGTKETKETKEIKGTNETKVGKVTKVSNDKTDKGK